MERAQKIKEVEFLTDTFKNARACVLADYRGLNVAEISDLRSRLRENGGVFKVIKNRLAKRALENASVEGLDEYLVGPTAVSYTHLTLPTKA